jgi:hypothetical protein
MEIAFGDFHDSFPPGEAISRDLWDGRVGKSFDVKNGKNNRTSLKFPRHCEPARAWQSPSFLQEIATSGFALLAMTW